MSVATIQSRFRAFQNWVVTQPILDSQTQFHTLFGSQFKGELRLKQYQKQYGSKN